jgi:glycerate kinase
VAMIDRPPVPVRDVALAALATRRLREIEAGPADREAKLVSASRVICDVLRELAGRTGAPTVYDEVIREYTLGPWWWSGPG